MSNRKQQGFTLIEIVMVLVLLGILAAVAAPKYFDLQKQAREQAALAVAAEYQARLNSAFAQELLKGEVCSAAKTNAINSMQSTNQITQTEWVIDDSALATAQGNSVAIPVSWQAKSATAATKIIDATIYLPECAAQ